MGDERKWAMKYERHLIKEFSMKNVVPRKKNWFYIFYIETQFFAQKINQAQLWTRLLGWGRVGWGLR
jgi:hypothetical protein